MAQFYARAGGKSDRLLGARYQIAKSTDLFAVYNSRKQDRDTNDTLPGVQDQFDILSIGLVTNFSSK